MLYAALRGQVSVYKRGYSPWQHTHQQTHVYSHNGDLFNKVGSDYIQNVSNLYIYVYMYKYTIFYIYVISHCNTYLDSSKLALD